ncbi:glucosamine-6-phosphate deaminase [Weissella hellenica]|uniref:Glucosamine-6-phosphate deaminase n=2 Tax=Weissella hellenica TaxID=46256 RepID=A0ABY0K1S3_WEIHE|nr:glucosamine-6-phosphate deaminase [Weissella hellenica]SCB89644.1 glucosamine-6-phosphate deaminase [Weissella hellenica]
MVYTKTDKGDIMMKIIELKDEQAGGKVGFEIFKEALADNAQVFGLATGSTPITIYKELTASDLDFSDKISINLDEYQGLPGTHEQSYRHFMAEHLFNQKPFKESYVPNGLDEDSEAQTAYYDTLIAEHPLDLQLLGLGQNGHIGFNEPGTPFDVQTRLVDLTPSTIAANARFFASEDEVPRKAFSMGIGSIMKSKKILLVAYGENKAQAVADMVEGPVTTDVPASVLQNHDDVTVIIDEQAASKIKNRDLITTIA